MFIKSENLKPSFVSGFALQNYSLAEQGIKDAFLAGFDYWYIDASLEQDAPCNWDESRLDRMKQLICDYNVYPILHGNYKVPLSSDVEELRQSSVKYTKSEIDLASELGAPLIVHGGVVVEPRLVKKIKKKAIYNFLITLDELFNYAINKNIEIYIENLSNYKSHPFHYIFTYEEEYDYIFSSLDAKMFFDIGHANIGNDSPISIFEKYADKIAGMSFSNNNGFRDQHLSLDKGSINYTDLVKSIVNKKWKGIVAFETRDVPPSKNICDIQRYINKL